MRIAIFSDTFFPQINGVTTTVYQSAKSLTKLGHEVMIFTVAPDAAKYIDPDIKNLAIVSLPSVPALIYPSLRFTLPLGFSLNKLRKFKPDIIHSHTPLSVGWEAVMCSKFFKIPLVGTHHTFYDDYLKHIKLDYKWGKKFSWKSTVGYYNRCNLVLSPTQSLADALKEQGLKKPVVILQNSIDTNLFRPATEAGAKEQLKHQYGIFGASLIFEGRLSYEKSIDQVIKAFVLMLKKMSELKLMLVGDGPERKNLEKLAEKLKIKDSVIFTGLLPYGEKIVEAYQASDIYITASKSENMPVAILEAMGCGLPIIAVKERGLAELVKENINGFFAKTDDPSDIAQKTLDLLNKPELLKKFSEASRVLARQYSHEQIAVTLEDLYKKLLKLI
ncbi:MAG TPA: hypothetical protein DHI91_02720 [Candidatus Portnoybacteria bacterium]|uniref:Glycosyltransferase family 4 protein n=1 Tax=Candidatus Portnoybacteria bacterium CG02_land_8_20_14_3_00_45_8 TaxID=1974807 RepID=A0A2M7D6G0_9BACT|nr:MAG: hypothetical protein COS30_01125 [Candidatus Portnoybacteria bacterium CG02_land_8_20_14_3_00_45_8]HCX28027.1 hypothetical protein [Candidatus Portnoybacteria bacterium]